MDSYNLEPENFSLRHYRKFFISITILFILIYAGTKNYLFFHFAVELATIIIGFSMTILAIDSDKLTNNSYYNFLGIAFFFVALFGVVHTATYKGMGIFNLNTANYATQMWIIQRYIQSISMVIAFSFINKKINLKKAGLIYALASVLLIASVFIWPIFPNCFVEGTGLTSFKRISELIITIIFAAALFLLYKNKVHFHKKVIKYISFSIILSIVSELFFVLYVTVYDLILFTGHIFNLLSIYAIYIAVVETSFKNPMMTLFNSVKIKNEELIEKEKELREKNAELNEKNVQLEEVKNMMLDSVEKYEQIIELLPDAVLFLQDGSVEYLNRKMREMVNVEDMERVRGRNIFELASPEYHNFIEGIISYIYSGNSIMDEEYTLKLKNGVELNIEYSILSFNLKEKKCALLVFKEARKVVCPVP